MNNWDVYTKFCLLVIRTTWWRFMARRRILIFIFAVTNCLWNFKFFFILFFCTKLFVVCIFLFLSLNTVDIINLGLVIDLPWLDLFTTPLFPVVASGLKRFKFSGDISVSSFLSMESLSFLKSLFRIKQRSDSSVT